MARLIADFDLDVDGAAAIMGNAGHESAGFALMQEIKPRRGRGGLGPFQWTGSRRVSYEAWLVRKGAKPGDFEADYAYLFRELIGPEKGAIPAVKRAIGLRAKVVAFELAFERAAADAKHYESRLRWAERARAAFQAAPTAVIVAEAAGEPVQGQEAPPAASPAPDAASPSAGLPSQRKGTWMDPFSLIVSAVVRTVTDAIRDQGTPLSSEQPKAVAHEVAAKVAAQPEVKVILDATRPIPWYRSQVFVGSLAALLSLAGKAVGVAVSPETFTGLIGAAPDIIAAAGALVALIGRVTSKAQPITATEPKP